MSEMELSEITRRRIAKWMDNASESALEVKNTWTERRLAIVFGGHTYLVANGQVFQCGHCGHFDPEWNATEVLQFFKIKMGIDPIEIDIVCSWPVAEESK
jgi:hypothetical protein